MKKRTVAIHYVPGSLAILFVLLTAACTSSRKTTAPAVNIEVPDTLPALPQSELDITLKAGARFILAKADSVVPRQFTSDAWPNYTQPSCDFRYKYRFFRSGLTVSCVDNNIAVRLSGTYQISGGRCLCTMDKPVSPWVSGSCGFGNEPLRRVNINVSSKLSFLPGYRISTVTKAARLEAVDKCSVSLFSTDVTQQVLDSIRASLVSFCSALDETVAGMNFKTVLQTATDKSLGKNAVANLGYLSLNPTSIRIGMLNEVKDTFSITAGISCRPQLSSDSSAFQTAVSLPALQSSVNREGISLYLEVAYSYAFLSKLLNDSLHNKVFDVKGRTIVIKEVSMKSSGKHRVEFRIDFAGSNKGRIYLYGTPFLDTAKQSVTIPDISYSLESGDLALKIARSLFRNKIRKTIHGSSYLDVASLVKSNLPTLNAVLNRKMGSNLFSTGKINELKLLGMLAGKDVFRVQVQARGNLALIYTDAK